MTVTSSPLAAFAAFLRREHVHALAAENLRLARELDVPLLRQFEHLSPEQLLELSVGGLEVFLQDLETGRALDAAAETLRQWEADRLEGISREAVEPSDMVLVNTAQKQAILRFVARFTSDAAAAMAIALELETFYATTQTESFKVFTRLREEAAHHVARLQAEHAQAVAHAEVLQSLNAELTAQSEELQQQTEELQASQEELARLYEALRVRNEQVESEVAERTRHLKDREAVLANAQKLSNCGSWEWHFASDRMAWSTQLCRIFGRDSGSSTPLGDLLAAVHGDDRPRVQAALVEARRTGAGFAFQMRIVRPDGVERVLDCAGEVLPDDAGLPRVARGVCLDITERRTLEERLQAANEELQSVNEELTMQAEELQVANEDLHAQTLALNEQRSFLAGIFENLPGGIAFLDRQLVYQTVNPTYAGMLGRTVEDFLHKPIFEVFPGTEDQIGAILEGVLASGRAYTAFSFPFEFEDARGAHRTYWDFTYAPIQDAAGGVTGILVLCTEVTPRVRLEREMAEQRALTERIVENAPVGIAFLDGELVYRRLNNAYAHLLGMTVEQVQDKSIYDVFPGATHQFEALMHGVMETGEPYRATNFSFRYVLNGEEKQTYWDFTYQPVVDERGRTGILILELEVSDRHERERLQAEQLEQLRELDRYKDEFLSVISHELRTPLNFITGFASTLEDEVQGPLNDGQHEAIGKILNGADRMLLLVDDLLDFAKIQSGRFDLIPAPADYASVVDEVVALLRPLADQKAVRLAHDVHVAGRVSLDVARISQVLTNLVGNAIKFTDGNGSVSVHARLADGRLRTEVRDTGCGIAAEHLPKLFNHFQQLDMSNTRRAGGTGLGLAISKALVEAHGGAIGVESAPGVGSTFWFELPV